MIRALKTLNSNNGKEEVIVDLAQALLALNHVADGTHAQMLNLERSKNRLQRQTLELNKPNAALRQGPHISQLQCCIGCASVKVGQQITGKQDRGHVLPRNGMAHKQGRMHLGIPDIRACYPVQGKY